MTSEPAPLSGPIFTEGVDITEVIESRPLLGQVQGEAVILVRRGEEFFAVGATCSHYGGPLAEGLIEGDTVRCPWHHACFDLRTGKSRAPALNAIDCYSVEQRNSRVYVLSKKKAAERPGNGTRPLQRIVIVGGGAAAFSAADTLRREGYSESIIMLSADSVGPVDRPNLSKDFLAGTAPEEWVPLKPPEYYEEQAIQLRLGVRAISIDTRARAVATDDGARHPFDALLLATGAEPVKLEVPGADGAKLHYLRSLGDCRAIMARLPSTKSVVVIGASFIGLEVAAALRTRGVSVHVVAPDPRPLGRVMGEAIGDFIRGLHEEHGVVFHLGVGVANVSKNGVTLTNGAKLECDLVIVGIGVRPRLELAERAGLALDRGIVVNEYLATSVPDIYAAGDIARWPDPHSGQRIRVEHWVVAQRHGELAARNMLGQRLRCEIVPYFWSQHYDTAISYVGHAEGWDQVDAEGSLAARDYTVALRSNGKTLAVITIGRDQQSLQAEAAFERRDPDRLATFGVGARSP